MGEMLSQDEINALLGGASEEAPSDSAVDSNKYGDLLSDNDKDILGEFANISMGTASTTLSTLLSHKVTIDTPKVSVLSWEDLKARYHSPFVGIKVDYRVGLKGSNIMVLQESDVKTISNIMMGGDGKIDPDFVLDEIDLSAIGEAMNQMVGSASTSLSSMINIKIDINTPVAYSVDLREEDFFEMVGFDKKDIVVCIYFHMKVGELIDSQIMQIINIDFAKEMVQLAMTLLDSAPDNTATAAPPQQPMPEPVQQNVMAPPPPEAAMPLGGVMPPPPSGAMPPQYPGYPPQGYMPYPPAPQPGYVPPQANVSPAQFQTFDAASVYQQKENIEIIMDVPLEVSVELGRTRKRIKDILEFAPGTIVELDKLAGEPIDVLVNGKFVAKGEVVVIDEKFGIRVSDIINPEHRI